MKRLVPAALLLAFLPLNAAHADASFPWGDRATAHIADTLHGTHRFGWADVCTFCSGIHGHSEGFRVPDGHGRRWFNAMHVDAGEGNAFAEYMTTNYPNWWLLRNGRVFVMPTRSKDDGRGGSGDTFRQAAMWARHRLGAGWTVVTP